MSDTLEKLDRRAFFARAALLGAAAVGAGSVLSACAPKKKAGATGSTAAPVKASAACDDPSKAKPAEVKQREALAYVSKTPNPAQNCANCVHYKPGQAGAACGGCAMNLGPVAPAGWCKVWAAKA